ncbi:MAG: class I SAM-dependent methyltransferase [Oscillospiraceae bacterium]|jgi:ubiquinone/menaquinone biosynthesis C-methylase UbiE|nr:class I SAM-dependent methyltransferase [Oscillospiraceae bacterium]
MNFGEIFSRQPQTVDGGIPYFGSDREGDQFDETDVAKWTVGGGFSRRWAARGTANEFRNEVYMNLCRAAAQLAQPIMDIASGPGLGLVPDVLAFNPNAQCLVTDACPTVVREWSRYLRENAPETQISFASFNAADMPLADCSVPVITSNIGFSSLRYAGENNLLGVREAYRVLRAGGYIFTVENEFEDYGIIRQVFDLWGRANWYPENPLPWRGRFESCGFVVESETPMLRRVETADFELGEVAASFGFEIAAKYTAFVLRKPR